MQRVDVKAEVIEVGDTRTVNRKDGGTAKVAEATIKDDSGIISLSLWDDQIEQAAKGIILQIKGGYVNNYKGDLKLNIGRYGSLIPVGKTEPPKSKVQLPIVLNEDFVVEVLKRRFNLEPVN